MLLLRSAELLARIDPSHGAEVLDLIDVRTGRQLLGRPPFRAADPLPGALTEEQWTLRYRGGWQLAIPNVGNMCTVDGETHGFHGCGSVDPWNVVAHDDARATLEWTGHGLHVTRRLTLAGTELRVETEARAVATAVPMIALEHCTVGLDILDPEVTLRLPRAAGYEVSEHGGPTSPAPDTPMWPQVRLLGGETESGDSWPIEQPRARWFVLHDVPNGAAEVINARHGTGLALTWDAAAMPHLHVWHLSGGGERFWRDRTHILGIEPTNVAHGLGLAEAVEAGKARRIDPHQSLSWWISARALA